MISSLAFVLSMTLSGGILQNPCEGLQSLTLPTTEITAAESIPAGPYSPPGRRGQASIDLPAHCRVSAVLTPSSDSHIEMEIWLPTENWNGKFLAVGNGGWAGSISFSAMASGLREGYATASNDTGHKGANGSFALGHPEKIVDFAYRAMHEMTVQSKAVVEALYDQEPRLSYYNGCSTGGRQGLMEAQRYPGDFDAIIAGAPVNRMLYMHAARMDRRIEILNDEARVLPPAKLDLLTENVLAACDASDGVKDRFVNNPRMCEFDPSTLLCTGGNGDSCLTAPQVETVRQTYAPIKTKSGELVFPGYSPGFEQGLSMPANSENPFGTALATFRYVAHQDADWDWQTFDMESDLDLVIEQAGFMNADDPDLTAFKETGGKLLLYHGWNDAAVAPENTVNYYSSVVEELGPGQDDWMRMFMVPGMGHCGGGPGPNQANFLGSMERWVETGVAPDRITASHVANGRVDMTRPLCPFPEVAKWNGMGSTNDAANFTCEAP